MNFKIKSKEEEILQSLKTNQVTIICTPTGSGKSLFVPYLAYQVSKRAVYCTVPRVVISKENTKGANSLVWESYETGAGYMTGRGGDSTNTDTASCIYISEGSFLIRGINEKLKRGDILLIDEVHELGINCMAVLSATFDMLSRGVKIVLMSATVDTKDYLEYYKGYNCGLIELQDNERPYPLTEKIIEDPIDAIVDAYLEGGRVLVGCSGKPMIETFSEAIAYNMKEKGLSFKDENVFPFHGELEQEQEDLALNHTGPMILLATNILQSAVTIKGINYIYVSGSGKRMESRGGMNSLVEYELSKAEMKQWYGRGGRTCPTEILITEDDKEGFEFRDSMPTPEILRTTLEEAVLQFSLINQDIRKAKLLKKPSDSEINRAFNVLKKLNLINEDSFLTETGFKVVNKQSNYRFGLIELLCEKNGIASIGKKLSAIMSVGHPFRKAEKKLFGRINNTDAKYMGYLQWIYVIDSIVDKFGYKVNSNDFESFKVFCEENGLFRKNLVRIMKKFEPIDQENRMPLPNTAYLIFNNILLEAYKDKELEEYHYIPDGCPNVIRPNDKENFEIACVGETNRVNRTVFQHINYVTYKA